MKVWVRATIAETLEPGWVISDGSTIADPSSNYNTKPIPDMRGTYPKGHATLSNATFGADVTYFAGGGGIASGGASSVNLNHNHSIGADGGHGHTVNNHGHGINNDAHTHGAPNGAPANVNNGSPVGKIDTYNHSHGGSTTGASPGTDSQGNHGHGFGTGGALGSTSIDPVNKTLLWIFKIK